MKQYKLVDNIMGWLVFAIAAFTYCSTIEPTASFWDCPEFITTGYKLEIGHPPGAPFFMLTANLFSHFASDPSQVARMVNTMSALLSATCILFLFWSITHLTRKLILKKWDELTTAKMIIIEAAGVVGALIYTWSDTFWFSAVEGEVYAYSSAFTAVVFWLILKWEDHADEPHSDRWLVLIAYMTGLSIGVHLLNLLCIPAIVLVYYYRKYPNANLKGSLLALVIGFVIVAAVLYGVVPGIITVGGWFELFFVNTLGCPFNTGEIIYIILLVAAVIWGIYESYTNNNRKRQIVSFLCAFGLIGIPFYGYGWAAFFTGVVVLAVVGFLLKLKKENKPIINARMLNTTLLCMLMLMIGYSSYALIVIRSSANPPMDQNSPEDIFTLGSYLSRDQYGDRPLFYGQAYTSEYQADSDGRVEMSKGAPIYERKEKTSKDEKDSYYIVSTKDKPKYVSDQCMFFPRMYDRGHAGAYEDWMGGVKGKTVQSTYNPDNTVKIPTTLENLAFFISYQCNYMYMRYFFWNFCGRQNDLQGNGELEHGNWISGIPALDNWRLGDQSKLPQDLQDNKGHNVFYCLPLLLGIIGLFWQAYRGDRGIKQFWVVFFLFFMTGLAIVIYLNQTPSQPRERDYAYAGSFYAFAIWCGIGVAGIYDSIKKWKKCNKINETVLAAVVSILCLLVPIQMVSQTWDDHDRSGRYTCRDFGQNYLMSMQEKGNPIIFTNGDNDTFPLWYNQEVEGVRTDTRVCNLSYLQTDWYIDQMRRPAYDSPSVPISWPRIDYCSGTNEMIQVMPDLKKQILDFYKANPAEAKKQFGDNPFELKNIMKYWVRGKNNDQHVIPTDTVYVTIDKEAVKKSGMLIVDTIPDKMVISLVGKDALYKNDLMMLEMIAQSNWTRPLYIATTVGADNYMNLGDNFILEGLANRITPFKTTKPGVKNIDTEKMYYNVMKRFKYGGLSTPGLYIDETVMRMCYTHRRLLAQLANALIDEHKNGKALNVLNKAEKEIPEYNVPMNYVSGGYDLAKAYMRLGQKAKAFAILNKMWTNATQYLTWYMSLDYNRFRQSMYDCNMYFQTMYFMIDLAKNANPAWAQKHNVIFEQLYTHYHNIGGQDPDPQQ